MASCNKALSCSHKLIPRLPNAQPTIKCQSFSDKGKPENRVDANMSILRKRIEEVREMEKSRLKISSASGGRPPENCLGRYRSSDIHNRLGQRGYQHNKAVWGILEIVGIASGSLGFVFFSGTLCIYLVSLVVHYFYNSVT